MRTAVTVIAWIWLIWSGLYILYTIGGDLFFEGLGRRTLVEVSVQALLAVPAILALKWSNRPMVTEESPPPAQDTDNSV